MKRRLPIWLGMILLCACGPNAGPCAPAHITANGQLAGATVLSMDWMTLTPVTMDPERMLYSAEHAYMLLPYSDAPRLDELQSESEHLVPLAAPKVPKPVPPDVRLVAILTFESGRTLLVAPDTQCTQLWTDPGGRNVLTRRMFQVLVGVLSDAERARMSHFDRCRRLFEEDGTGS